MPHVYGPELTWCPVCERAGLYNRELMCNRLWREQISEGRLWRYLHMPIGDLTAADWDEFAYLVALHRSDNPLAKRMYLEARRQRRTGQPRLFY